jgi:hypothetical protein
MIILETKQKRKQERSEIRKLNYYKSIGSHLMVIPMKFVREAKLKDSYIKVTLLENEKLLLERVSI